MGLHKQLEEAGLTRNEAKVYLELLKMGQSKTGEIIKKTGIHTSKVYDSLDRLINKGLASYILISNVKHFNAAPAKRIVDYLENKKKDIEEKEKNIKKHLSNIELLRAENNIKSSAEIFEGWKGMETVYKLMRDSLKKGDINYVIGAGNGADIGKVKLFFNRHLNLLAKKKINQRIIYNESSRGNISEQYKHPGLFEVKYMEDTTLSEINIWGDNIMIVILKENPKIILIKDPEVSRSYIIFFKMLWKIARS